LKSVIYFSDAPYFGGAEKYLLLLAENIQDFGFRPLFIINRKERLGKLVEKLESAGIDVFDVNINLPYSLNNVGKLIGIFRSTKSDILHLNLPGPYSAQYSLVAPIAKMAGIRKIVSTEHLPMVSPFRKGKILKSFGNLFIDRVITVSKDNVKHLEKKHGIKKKKISVIYLGIPDITVERDGAKERIGFSDKDIIVAVIGSLEERKGQKTALEVIEKLPVEYKLLLVGTGPLEKELKSMVENLGLVGRVHFMGYVDDISSVLSATDVLMVTSSLEATPFVVIEAMAAGVPVVANAIYGLTEMVEDGVTGLLVPPGDAVKTAEAVTSIASDRLVWEGMSAAAREFYNKRFKLERFVAETASVYDEVLG